MDTTLPGVERRLQKRYQQRVQEHTGPRHLPGPAGIKAATQTAWRFYRNPRVTPTG